VKQLLMFRPHLESIPSAESAPTGYEVRRFGPDDDIEALGETLNLAFEREFDWSVEKVRERLTDDPNVRAIYAAFWQGKAVATTSSLVKPDKYPGTGIVHWVATHPDHLRKGLGTVLMERVLRDFVEHGDREALLETDDQRLPAIKRYLAFGFLPRYENDGEDLRRRWSAVFQAIGTKGTSPG
jgi:mycothiol synthase